MHARTDIGVAQYKSEPLTDGVHSASEGAPHHFWIQSAPFNNIVLVLRHVAKVKKKKKVFPPDLGMSKTRLLGAV